MTSVTSVNPVESRVEIARREIDWRAWRIRYRDVSKGELESAGGLALFFYLAGGGGDWPRTVSLL